MSKEGGRKRSREEGGWHGMCIRKREEGGRMRFSASSPSLSLSLSLFWREHRGLTVVVLVVLVAVDPDRVPNGATFVSVAIPTSTSKSWHISCSKKHHLLYCTACGSAVRSLARLLVLPSSMELQGWMEILVMHEIQMGSSKSRREK